MACGVGDVYKRQELRSTFKTAPVFDAKAKIGLSVRIALPLTSDANVDASDVKVSPDLTVYLKVCAARLVSAGVTTRVKTSPAVIFVPPKVTS